MIRKPSLGHKINLSLILLAGFLSNTGFLRSQVVASINAENPPPISLSESVVQSQSFLDFVETVRDDNRKQEITGLYANENWHFFVVSDDGIDGNLSVKKETLTESTTDEIGNSIAILAHNGVGEGEHFLELNLGQELVAINGDGSFERFQIIQQKSYQLLDVEDSAGDYFDLETGDTVSGYQVWSLMFAQNPPHTLIMQTCLIQDGVLGWGRYFLKARFLDDRPVVLAATPVPTATPTVEDLELVTKEPLPDKQPTALCRDGWTSYATPAQRANVCSRHQGLFRWLDTES